MHNLIYILYTFLDYNLASKTQKTKKEGTEKDITKGYNHI